MDLSIIQPLLDWVQRNPHVSGVIIFAVASCESLALIGIIVPGVVFMLGIGALVGLNAISLPHALVWAALGAISGDWISYWLGRHFDQQLRHVWPLSRYPQLIPKGERFFRRHGGMSVLFGRFVGPLRPIVPAIAGIMHMPQIKFYVINVVSAVLWAPVVILPGVAFGESIQLANHVFGKIILLIVILVVALVLFAYIFKKLFSYALMVSIDTLSDYFGMQQAKENLVSLSLMAMLISSMVLFIYQYDIRNQPLANNQQAVDFRWWENHWPDFARSHIRNRAPHPITLQWWGEKNDILQILHNGGWRFVPSLNLKSSMNFFLPDPDVVKLPIPSEKLFNAKQAFMMVASDPHKNHYWLVRLWAANPAIVDTLPQLWLGTIYDLEIFSPFNLIYLPVPQYHYSSAISHFAGRMKRVSSNLVVKKQFYPEIGTTDDWQGDVLLLYFAGASSSEPTNSRTYSKH